MMTTEEKIFCVLTEIKAQIELASHSRVYGYNKKDKEKSEVVVESSEIPRDIGIQIYTGDITTVCDLNFKELKNVLEKIKEEGFLEYFSHFFEGSYGCLQIIPSEKFSKLYKERELKLNQDLERNMETITEDHKVSGAVKSKIIQPKSKKNWPAEHIKEIVIGIIIVVSGGLILSWIL